MKQFFYQKIRNFLSKKVNDEKTKKEVYEFLNYLEKNKINEIQALDFVYTKFFNKINFEFDNFLKGLSRYLDLKNKKYINEKVEEIIELLSNNFNFVIDKYTVIKLYENFKINNSVIVLINSLYENLKNINEERVQNILKELKEYVDKNYIDLLIIETLEYLELLPNESPDKYLLKLEDVFIDFIASDKNDDDVNNFKKELEIFNNNILIKNLLFNINEKFKTNNLLENLDSLLRCEKMYSFSIRENNDLIIGDFLGNIYKINLNTNNINLIENNKEKYNKIIKLNKILFENSIFESDDIIKINLFKDKFINIIFNKIIGKYNFIYENKIYEDFEILKRDLNKLLLLDSRAPIILSRVNEIINNINNLLLIENARIIFKDSNNIILFKINVNEYSALIQNDLKQIFLKSLTPDILINEIKEITNFDLSEFINEENIFSLEGFRIDELKNTINLLKHEINELEEIKYKILETLKDEEIDFNDRANLEEILQLTEKSIRENKSFLETKILELNKIKDKNKKVKSKIDDVKIIFDNPKKISDESKIIPDNLKVNASVYCSDIDQEGTIISINTIKNIFTVLLNNGKQITYKINDFDNIVKVVNQGEIEDKINKSFNVQPEYIDPSFKISTNMTLTPNPTQQDI